jgi:hypothetical protein
MISGEELGAGRSPEVSGDEDGRTQMQSIHSRYAIADDGMLKDGRSNWPGSTI